MSREPGVDAERGELPRAVLVSNEASAFATRLVLWATVIVLAALVLLTVIGPHIPSGE